MGIIWTKLEAIPHRQTIYINTNSITVTEVTKLMSEGVIVRMQGEKYPKHAVIEVAVWHGIFQYYVVNFTLWTTTNSLISKWISYASKWEGKASYSWQKIREGRRRGEEKVNQMGKEINVQFLKQYICTLLNEKFWGLLRTLLNSVCSIALKISHFSPQHYGLLAVYWAWEVNV